MMGTRPEAVGAEATKAAAVVMVVAVTRVVETGVMAAWVRVATRVHGSGAIRAVAGEAGATVVGATANQPSVWEATTRADKGTTMEEAIREGGAGGEEVATRATDSTGQVQVV